MNKLYTMVFGGILVGSLTASLSAAVIYENSLQNGPDPAWTVTRGSWNWTDQGVSNAHHTENRVFLNLPEDIDLSEGYQVSFSAMLDQGQGWGFFFNSEVNSSDKKVDGFTFQYDPGYGKGAYLLRGWENDRERCLKAVGSPLNFDVFHDFKLDIQPDSLAVYQNGNLVLSYEGELPVLGSSIGFRTWSSADATFRNLSLASNVPEPATLILFSLVGLGVLQKSRRV